MLTNDQEIILDYPFATPVSIEEDATAFIIRTDKAFDVRAVEEQLEDQGVNFEQKNHEKLSNEQQNYYGITE